MISEKNYLIFNPKDFRKSYGNLEIDLRTDDKSGISDREMCGVISQHLNNLNSQMMRSHESVQASLKRMDKRDYQTKYNPSNN